MAALKAREEAVPHHGDACCERDSFHRQIEQLRGPRFGFQEFTTGRPMQLDRERFYMHRLPDLDLTPARCPKWTPVVPTEIWPPQPTGGAVRITVKIAVEDPDGGNLARIARGLDPQSWDVCSKFFPYEHTFLMTKPHHPMPACYASKAGALPPGSHLDGAALFEWFRGVSAGSVLDIRNVLGIYSGFGQDQQGRKTYTARYKLDEPVCATINKQPVAYHLAVDQGSVTATDLGPSIAIESTKNLAWSLSSANIGTRVLFHSMAKELGEELHEMACCGVLAFP